MTKEGKLRKNGARAGRVTKTWPLIKLDAAALRMPCISL